MRKKITLIATIMLVIVGMTACSQTENENKISSPIIDKNVTIKQAMMDAGWDDDEIASAKYTVFDAWKEGKKSIYKYAVIKDRKPNESGEINTALVYFADSKKSKTDYGYPFECKGVYVDGKSVKNGEIITYKKVPIGNESGGQRDIHIGYSKDGDVEIDNMKMACEEDGTLIYMTDSK